MPERISHRNYMILFGSILAGVFVDALAERIVGQDYFQDVAASSVRYEPLRQDDEKNTDEKKDDEKDNVTTPASGLQNLTKPLWEIHVAPGAIAQKMPEDNWAISAIGAGNCNYPGSFQQRLAAWESPNIAWNPLYFEDVSLERYGYTGGPIAQPVRSAAFFGASLLMLPVNLVRDNPFQCDTPLGYCRPGSPAPYVVPRWIR